VLCDFPHTAGAIPPDYLLDLIPRIRPRAFSIASSLLVRGLVTSRGETGTWQDVCRQELLSEQGQSLHLRLFLSGVGDRQEWPSKAGHPLFPQVHPARLQILVAVVQYQTRLKEPRRGLCSSWLASLDPAQGDPFFWEENAHCQWWAWASVVSSAWSFESFHATSFLQQDLSRYPCGCGLGA
jgi:hypothetical protein